MRKNLLSKYVRKTSVQKFSKNELFNYFWKKLRKLGSYVQRDKKVFNFFQKQPFFSRKIKIKNIDQIINN